MMRMKDRQWTILFIAAGLIALAAFGGMSFYALNTIYNAVGEINAWREQMDSIGDIAETVITQRGSDAAAAINALPGVRLPAEASDIYFAREGTTNLIYWIRFETPPAALSDFLATTCFRDAPLAERYTPDFAYDSDPGVRLLLDWWQPDAPPAERQGGRCSPQRGVSFEVLVDQTLANAWLVYFEIVVS